MSEDMLKRDKVSREAHARLWSQYQQALNDLAQAKATIARLQLQRVVNVLDPLEPKTVIGIVKCPKCGQYMEVEK